MMFAQYKRGVTLFEVLIAVTIIGVITGLAIISLSNFREAQALKDAKTNIFTMFDQAKSRTISSENFSVFGIHLEAGSVTVFEGSSYDVDDPNNSVFTLDGTLELVNIVLNGGGSDVVYERVTGSVNTTGTFDVRLINDTSQSTTFTILPTGVLTST